MNLKDMDWFYCPYCNGIGCVGCNGRGIITLPQLEGLNLIKMRQDLEKVPKYCLDLIFGKED